MVSVLFENPKSDINIETMARTTNFFGIDFHITNTPKKKLSNKKSAGAIKNKYPKLLDIDNWKGRIIVTDSQFEIEPQDFIFMDNDLIVFGNESIGVSDKAKALAFGFIGIKQKGDAIRCLNVSNACAVILGIINAKLKTSALGE